MGRPNGYVITYRKVSTQKKMLKYRKREGWLSIEKYIARSVALPSRAQVYVLVHHFVNLRANQSLKWISRLFFGVIFYFLISFCPLFSIRLNLRLLLQNERKKMSNEIDFVGHWQHQIYMRIL